ncbi:hypothetical protein U1Q18_012443 [Sarracenia purpurea var. burkii]
MESRAAIWAVGMLFFTAAVGGANGRNCGFPAIFNFGDSNSDTGSGSAAFIELVPPYGMSFRNMSKRASDGRLIIDFIAEHLGLPYLDGSLDSIGTNFRHGANFAVGGAKISPVVIQGVSIPIHLDVQVSQFLQFKSHSIAHHRQLRKKGHPPLESNLLPAIEDFSKALYTIDIGQNDITTDLYNSSISTIIDQFSNSLQRLLKNGAKFVWIHNTGPQGCLPGSINECLNKSSCLDEIGCAKGKNQQSQEFNQRLKHRIYELRAQYPRVAITYVDVYSAKYALIANAKRYGFYDLEKFCCGNKGPCGTKAMNGTLIGTACNDPSHYTNWDGIHYTQAANRFVANLILNGSLSDPPLPVSQACHKSMKSK